MKNQASFSFAGSLKKHTCSGLAGKGFFSAYTYEGKWNWLTQVFSPGYTRKLGNLETGSFKAKPRGRYFSLSSLEELLISSRFEETQEGMCAGS